MHGLGFILVFLAAVVASFSVSAAPSRIDRLLEGRMESNCFFSPMGCVFLPRNYNRVRRLLAPAQPEQDRYD